MAGIDFRQHFMCPKIPTGVQVQSCFLRALEHIELYVRAEFKSLVNRGRLRVTNASMKDDIKETLVKQAQGM